MKSKRRFEGKTVLVTGAGGGLGAALCRRFAQAGARIGGLDLSQEGLQRMAREVEGLGAEVATVEVDLRQEQHVHAAVQSLEQQLGPIDALINNAGVTHLKNFDGQQSADVRRVMEVNFLGAVYCTAAAYESLLTQRGLIIAISSVAGYAPLVGRTAYCASKHALQGFCNTLRLELRQTDVDVLLVCPSFIATGLRDAYRPTESSSPAPTDKGQTVGREDSPEHVAQKIFDAATRRRRQISVGRVGHVSYWLNRLVPRLYEQLMLRSIRDE